jgi:hypothetical protein
MGAYFLRKSGTMVRFVVRGCQTKLGGNRQCGTDCSG